MQKYVNLYKWMLIPFFIMQLGIFMDYWGDFTDNAWSVHVHYWTGSIWYIYLIIQPYYATHGQMAKHRTNGIIGMFLAGGVGLTALSMMHRDIVSSQRASEFPELFGPFKPWFFYGIIVVEIVMISAFLFAIIKSIIHRKQLEHHAWWLISTAFIIMMPALARGIGFVWIAIVGFDPNLDISMSLYLSEFIILTLIIWAAIKYKKLKHPATYLAIGVNLFNCLVEPIGKLEWVQTFLQTIIK